jgi:Putative beta-lactamase-inhibitor-like, PepSY-like
MKKTLAVMLMMLMCAGVTVAQKTAIKKPAIEKITPPEMVLNAFKEKFADAKPMWSKSNNGNFMAHIDSSANSNKQYVEFNAEGKWLSTATVVSFEQLSEAAQKKIKEQYAEMQVDVVKKIEREGISAFYKVKLIKDKESKTVYINDAGFVSE